LTRLDPAGDLGKGADVNRKIRAIRLQRLQHRLGEVASQITTVRFAQWQTSAVVWHPSINAFLCGRCVRVCFDVAGVRPEDIQLTYESGRLIIRGSRAAPEPIADASVSPLQKAVHVLAMEIDHGQFERVVDVPPDIDPERITTEWANGFLWVYLQRQTQA
jgi:HSP20 family protein